MLIYYKLDPKEWTSEFESKQNVFFETMHLKMPILFVAEYKLDMSTARQRRKSPRSLSGTSAHPTMATLVNIMVLNGWLTSFSFHVNQAPHSWDKAISDSDLETPKVKVMGVVKEQGHTVGPESY